jgi:hypothetical protein
LRDFVNLIDPSIDAASGDSWLGIHSQSKRVCHLEAEGIAHSKLDVIGTSCICRWKTAESPCKVAESQPALDTSCQSINVRSYGEWLIHRVPIRCERNPILEVLLGVNF